MTDLKAMIDSFAANLDKELKDFPILSNLEKRVGVRPSYMFIAVILVVIAFSILDVGADLVTTLFGMLYPAYMSFKVFSLPSRLSTARIMSRKRFG
jgi:hypothetical protein